MKKTDDPCSICENYSAESGFICDFDENCPVAVMKRQNEILISTVASLRRRLDRMKSAQAGMRTFGVVRFRECGKEE